MIHLVHFHALYVEWILTLFICTCIAPSNPLLFYYFLKSSALLCYYQSMHADALKRFALAQPASLTTTTTPTTFSVVICKFFMHAEQAKIPITHLILTRGEKFCSSSALPLLVSKRARRRTENVLQCLPSLSLEKGFYSH